MLTNPTTSRNLLIRDGCLPLDGATIDLIICDYVLEHISDVESFRDEVFRVLKPGGVFCGRTPHALNYVSLAARLVKNANHAKWLAMLQPSRKREDVFSTAYRCNTLRGIGKIFRGWQNFSYLYASEPQYYCGSKLIYHLFDLVHRLAPLQITGNLFVFLRKLSPEVTLLEQSLLWYARHFPIAKGKLRVVNALSSFVRSGNTQRMAHLIFGDYTVPCDINNMLSRQLYFFGTYFIERKQIDIWRRFAADCHTVFDVGANAGIYSMAALSVAPQATVHAFEPTPEIAERLRRTQEINSLSKLVIHEVALSDQNGKAHLTRCDGGADNDG